MDESWCGSQESRAKLLDCGDEIKQEIKEEGDTEIEINPFYATLSVKSEDVAETRLESELESINCKEAIKHEIEQETQEIEDLKSPFFIEDSEHRTEELSSENDI